MKRIFIIFCIFLGYVGVAGAQNRVINLEKPEWKKIMQEASQSKKMIFVDCHASWCGPCKMLVKNVFTQDSVADYFNEHFVCVSYNIEKDPKPPVTNGAEVKSVPTLWFIDPQSREIVYGMSGAPDAAKLMKLGRTALDPLRNFQGMKKRQKEMEQNPDLFFAYYNALKAIRWTAEYTSLGQKYMQGLKPEQYAEMRNWELFEDLVNDPLNLVFQQVCGIQDLLKEKIGKERVERKINPNLIWGAQHIVDWEDPKDMPSDSAYVIMTHLVHSAEFQQKEWMTRILEADKYARQGEWYLMLARIQGILDYFGCANNQTEWSVNKFLGKLLKNATRPQLKRGVECIDLVIAVKNESESSALLELKKRLLMAIADR